MTPRVADPIGLEIRWDRLTAATDEAASTVPGTAFSTIIRESNDYRVVPMDRQGRTVAESRAGIPGFAALMSSLTALVLDRSRPGNGRTATASSPTTRGSRRGTCPTSP
ncbi:hydantoinase/oxoprolinase-like protein [Lentzea atacamensis]|uniref:Hydantoinase/oxoprolinase-like protein n=1 Tax=Lentzea atacamensis TaxID=531938 RepID=A0A316HZE4_9PSEU|nr:hydantoinase B/oxoprolinase family protein [Lentzea atacamensis]PWK83572.1 hydantoinase/oxoprolinase-like protein [Lentzea atacamensis]